MPTTTHSMQNALSWRVSGSLDRIGFFSLGGSLLLFSLQQTNLLLIDNYILGVLLFGGGLSQLLAGLASIRVRHLFGSVTFIAFGFFWLSMIALFITPGTGLTHSPKGIALSSYTIMWGVFAGLIYLGALEISLTTRLLFAMLSVNFAILAFGQATMIPGALLFGGLFGVVCGGLFVFHALCHEPGWERAVRQNRLG